MAISLKICRGIKEFYRGISKKCGTFQKFRGTFRRTPRHFQAKARKIPIRHAGKRGDADGDSEESTMQGAGTAEPAAYLAAQGLHFADRMRLSVGSVMPR